MGWHAPAGTAASLRELFAQFSSHSRCPTGGCRSRTRPTSHSEDSRSVSRFTSQTRSGTSPNLRGKLNGDRAPRTSGAPTNHPPCRVSDGFKRAEASRFRNARHGRLWSGDVGVRVGGKGAFRLRRSSEPGRLVFSDARREFVSRSCRHTDPKVPFVAFWLEAAPLDDL